MRASDECRVLPHILHLLGKGGEHLVFEDVRYPNYVLKVDFIESLPVLYAQTKGRDAIENAIRKLDVKAKEHNKRLKILRSYFLSDSVPLELVAVKEIPLSEEIVLSVMRDRNLDIPQKMFVPENLPLLCTIQHKIKLLKDTRVDIYSSYAELNRTILLEYFVEGHRLLAGSESIGPVDHQAREKVILFIYPSLRSVVEKMKSDNEFKQAIGHYVKRAMAYSVDTGEIIDMAGGGNVLMVKDHEQAQRVVVGDHEQAQRVEWLPFLMDALSPPELNFKLLQQSALKLKHDQELDVREKANTLNVINYVRFANALAMLAGLPDRLDVAGMTEVAPEVWHRGLMIEKYLDTYTPKKAVKR